MHLYESNSNIDSKYLINRESKLLKYFYLNKRGDGHGGGGACECNYNYCSARSCFDNYNYLFWLFILSKVVHKKFILSKRRVE